MDESNPKINITKLREDLNLLMFNHFGTDELEFSNDLFKTVEKYIDK